MVTYYSIWALFATHLQKDLGLGSADGRRAAGDRQPGRRSCAMGFWGWVGDVLGRRWSMIIPASIGIFVTPTYLLTADPTWIVARVHRPVGVRRRDVQPDAELPDRALPDRGAGHRKRLLLPSGGDLRRRGGAGADLLRGRLSARLRHPDADRHQPSGWSASSSRCWSVPRPRATCSRRISWSPDVGDLSWRRVPPPTVPALETRVPSARSPLVYTRVLTAANNIRTVNAA